MKKTKLTRSLLAACSIVALSVAVYGCDSGPSQDEYDAVKAEADANAAAAAAAAAAQAQAEAAAAAAAAAQAQAEAAKADAEAKAAADVAAAQAAADAAEAAAMAAAEAQAAAEAAAAAQADADADKVQAAVDAAAAAAEQAAAAATEAAEAKAAAEKAAADLAAAEKARMDAEAAAEAARMAQEEAERKAAEAEGKTQELEDKDADAAAAAASEAAKELLNMALPNVNVDRDGTEGAPITPVAPTIALSVSNEGVLTAKATNYTMSATAPDMIEGFRGAMLSDRGGDTAVVYSDIGNDGTVTLLDRYTSNLPTATAARSWDIDDDDTNDANNADNDISWTAVKRPDDMTTVGGTSANPITMFEGSVHGISGTFTCDAADAGLCTAPERYSDGSVNAGTSGLPTGAVAWKFTPDEGSITYTDDLDYVMFGWWLDYGADGKPDTLRLYADATGLGSGDNNDTARTTDDTAGNAIRGSATYEGGAAGKYAFASTSDATYEGGHFTADASLTVDFDADNTPGGTNDRNGVAISGMIDNFMTGATARPTWNVKLMVDNDANNTNPVAPVANLVGAEGDARRLQTEWSTGAAAKGTGTWTADWYGGATAAANTGIPTAVVGTFNAHIGTVAGTTDTGAIGRIQGAFGASKQ